MHTRWLLLLIPARAIADDAAPVVTVGGYVEASYQLHAQDPDNGITALRGFDDRSRTFALSNLAVDVRGARGPVTTHVVLQIGQTATSAYLAEPSLPGGSGAGATDASTWRFVQTATLAARATALTFEAGLFTSPIGPEAIAVKDNWSWSRSDLFFGLPFYHVGVRASRPLGGGWTATAALYNGWNNVTDNNRTPSVSASLAYASGDRLGQLLYFGGVERSPGAPEGEPWRHLIDGYIQHPLSSHLTVLAHADAGFERTALGTAWWIAGALSGRWTLGDRLYTAARADLFREHAPPGVPPIAWPTTWIGSATWTLAYQPVAGLSLRVEVRHDRAAGEVFFGGHVEGDGVTAPFVPNRATQDTVTAGVTAWF